MIIFWICWVTQNTITLISATSLCFSNIATKKLKIVFVLDSVVLINTFSSFLAVLWHFASHLPTATPNLSS